MEPPTQGEEKKMSNMARRIRRYKFLILGEKPMRLLGPSQKTWTNPTPKRAAQWDAQRKQARKARRIQRRAA